MPSRRDLIDLAVHALEGAGAREAGQVVRTGRAGRKAVAAPQASLAVPRRRIKPQVRTDNPGGEWLKHEQRRAAERYSQDHPVTGAVTGYLRKPIELDPQKLANIPGARGERRVPGEAQYDRLRPSVEEHGLYPDSPILVGVNHLGEPYIIEGNTRAAVARDLGLRALPAEVRYFAGGEQAGGRFAPELLEQYMPPSELALDPNFRRFFEGSRLVDEYGEPMMFYHGTSKDAAFNKMRVPKNGAWFAKSPKEASDYAIQNDSMDLKPAPTRENPWAYAPVNTASRVMPVYLNAQNPMMFTDPREFNDMLMQFGSNYKRGQGLLFDRFRNEGYDSVVLGDNDVVTILRDPTQIKSASGNRGTYDPEDPDIRKARGGLAVRKAA
jgi:hypothetical protein